jgi:uncharacterized SAM-binding protein YcdF (DUF218 family)
LISIWELTNATARLVLPPGGLIVLAMLGLGLARSHARSGTTLTLLALIGLYVLSTPLASRSLLQTLEDPYVDPSRDRAAGAIVVLGGGSNPIAPEYGEASASAETLTRLRYAVHLHKQTGKPLLLSGGSPSGSGTSEGEQMNTALRDFGVTAKWVESTSNNTLESARYTQKTLKRAGIDRVYIVTHAWHMPRSKMAFQNAGLQVVPAPTYYTGSRQIMLPDFFPSASGMLNTYAFFHEIAGIAWYRLKFARER